MLLERRVVEREVRRRDHGHRIGAGLGGMSRRALRSRQSSARRNEPQRRAVPSAAPHEQLEQAHPLGRGEQDPLTGRAAHEDPVHPALGEERDVGLDGRLVERCPAVPKRRQRRRERTPDHELSIRTDGSGARSLKSSTGASSAAVNTRLSIVRSEEFERLLPSVLVEIQ